VVLFGFILGKLHHFGIALIGLGAFPKNTEMCLFF